MQSPTPGTSSTAILGVSFAEIARHVGVTTSSIRKAVMRSEEK
ncbi:MAG TPA: hypothetical protein VN604_01730 [Nitrospirota bacterium]|nr:hypothetical protein [Nitrospirota bacterium]